MPPSRAPRLRDRQTQRGGPAERLTVLGALDRLPHGARVVATPCCGEPTSLLAALNDIHGDRRLSLYSGLLLGYSFMGALRGRRLRYVTWHPTQELSPRIEDGSALYVPLRAGDVHGFIEDLAPDVALVRVTPPDGRGFCSLGPSASYSVTAVRHAALVIAEVDPQMPATSGATVIHESAIDVLVESTTRMRSYSPRYRSACIDAITANIAGFVQEGSCLQIGIGAIPEAFARSLVSTGASGLRMIGMATDALVDLFEGGRLAVGAPLSPPVMAVELMGGPRLMRFADRNPLITMYASDVAHDPCFLRRLERFVSVNSALQVDLGGAIYTESVGPEQLSGVGGSCDFAEAARAARAGVHVIALPSTTANGQISRIVPESLAHAPATIPRHMCDVVATEYGVARLRGLSLQERRRALIAIAHPDFRDALARDALNTQRTRQRKRT